MKNIKFLINNLVLIFFSLIIQCYNVHGMEQLLDRYSQDSIDNFNRDKHFDFKNNLHYGYIVGFEEGVNHKSLPKCSLQKGLQTGKNVYVGDGGKTLIITEYCTHWIDINPDNLNEANMLEVDRLVNTINHLNRDRHIDTIRIYIDMVLESFIHRFSTHSFSRFEIFNIFDKLNNIKNIYYVPVSNCTESEKPYRLFVSQDVFYGDDSFLSQDGTRYTKRIPFYFPLVLIDPNKQYTILINGLIEKRNREKSDESIDESIYDDVSFFQKYQGLQTKKYAVKVHPEIVIQEIVHDNSICEDRINRYIGRPPLLNRMKEYDESILNQFAGQYAISLDLLRSDDQREQHYYDAKSRGRILDFTCTSEYRGNQFLEECLQCRSNLIFIKDNKLILENEQIDCMNWVEEKKGDDQKELYERLSKKLYFLCWLKSINTIEIRLPESCSNASIAQRSLSVLSSHCLNLFKSLHPLVKNIQYIPYKRYQHHEKPSAFLYIDPANENILQIKDKHNMNNDLVFTIDSLNFTINKNVQINCYFDESIRSFNKRLKSSSDKAYDDTSSTFDFGQCELVYQTGQELDGELNRVSGEGNYRKKFALLKLFWNQYLAYNQYLADTSIQNKSIALMTQDGHVFIVPSKIFDDVNSLNLTLDSGVYSLDCMSADFKEKYNTSKKKLESLQKEKLESLQKAARSLNSHEKKQPFPVDQPDRGQEKMLCKVEDIIKTGLYDHTNKRFKTEQCNKLIDFSICFTLLAKYCDAKKTNEDVFFNDILNDNIKKNQQLVFLRTSDYWIFIAPKEALVYFVSSKRAEREYTFYNLGLQKDKFQNKLQDIYSNKKKQSSEKVLLPQPEKPQSTWSWYKPWTWSWIRWLLF